MNYTKTEIEREMKRIVGIALRAETDDVVSLGHLFHENVANFISSHSGAYTLPSLLHTLAVSGAALSRTNTSSSILFKVPALGRAGDEGQMVHVLINRGPVAEGGQPLLIADTTVGDAASYPNPLWAGRFMARVIRTPEDIGHAIRMLFAMLMILRSGDSRDGMLSAVARSHTGNPDEPSVQDDDLVVTMLVGQDADSQIGIKPSAEDRRIRRLSQTMEVPQIGLARAIYKLESEGYQVARIDEHGDWAKITFIPQGA